MLSQTYFSPRLEFRPTVDDSLRNSLSVKVGEQIDQVEVLQEQGTVGADSLDLCEQVKFQPIDN